MGIAAAARRSPPATPPTTSHQVEFKLVEVDSSGAATWEGGANRTVRLPAAGSDAAVISCKWGEHGESKPEKKPSD